MGPLEPRSGLFAQVAGDSVFILNVFRRRDLDLADVIPLRASEHKGKAVHKARGISKECHVGNGGRSKLAMMEFSTSITFVLEYQNTSNIRLQRRNFYSWQLVPAP